MNVPNRFSLRLSLASALVGAVLLTSVLLGGTTFSLWRQSLRDDLSRQLAGLAGTAALLVDPQVHRTLAQASDMDGILYKTLRQNLMAVRQRNPEVHFLYTFRWTPGEPGPRFVLDTGTPGVDFSPLGQAYKTMTPTLRLAFEKPYQVRVESEVYTDEYGTFLSAFAPLVAADGTLVGVLGLDIDASRVQALEGGLVVLVGGLTLGITVLMALLSWWFSRRITQPLSALSRDMGRIQEFQLDGEVVIDTRISEVVTMKDSLENMKRGLRSFKKFVPADLVAQLIGLQKEAVLGTEKAEVTVFFCDLAQFTTASEMLSSDDLNRLLTGYFELVTRTLQSHGATVDKFIGDAVMAFWNAPKPVDDHPWRAAVACLEVHQGLEALARDWKRQGLPPLSTRIGLNTGTVLVGNVGHENRLSYTVLGDPVNLASRLESLNKYYGTSLLVGEQTLRVLGSRLAWRPVDRVAVKGKSQGTLIGELVSVAPAWWPAYRAAWTLYEQGDYPRALAGFEGCSRTGEPDGVSQVLAARCRRFLESGVPADWTGVWVMQDK
jgi:class 3 adenylate cyclase